MVCDKKNIRGCVQDRRYFCYLRLNNVFARAFRSAADLRQRKKLFDDDHAILSMATFALNALETAIAVVDEQRMLVLVLCNTAIIAMTRTVSDAVIMKDTLEEGLHLTQ